MLERASAVLKTLTKGAFERLDIDFYQRPAALFINFDDDRSKAALQALFDLSKKTQVTFLSHHEHLVPATEKLFGAKANIISLNGVPAAA